MFLAGLNLEKLDLRLRVNSRPSEACRQHDETSGFEAHFMFTVREAQAPLDQRQNLQRLAAEVKALAAFDFAAINVKERVMDQITHGELRIARVFAGDEMRFVVTEIDAGE